MKIRTAYHQAMMMNSNVDPTHPLPFSTSTCTSHLHLHPENPNNHSTDHSLNNTIDINSVPVSMIKKRSNALAFQTTQTPNHLVNQDKPNPKKHCFMMKGTNLTLKLLLSEPHRPSDDDDDQNNIINPIPVSMVNNHGVRIFPHNLPIRRSRPNKTASCLNQQNRPSDDQLLELLRKHINANNFEFKDVSNAKLILEKELTQTDLKDDQARLAIPKLQTTEFLTPEEETSLATKMDVNKNNKIDVKVIMESSVYNMCLSRWNYGNNNSNWKYVLKNEWKKLKMDKDLKAGDIIRIVSFRSEKRLNFAIIGPKSAIKLQDGSCFKLFGTIMETSPWW